ncbi:MAG TPA: NrfD/PsrC family molybdoenzyme membrane anchor subunit [Acidobacteriota bacterium]
MAADLRALHQDLLRPLEPTGPAYKSTVLLLALIAGWGGLCWLYMMYNGLGVSGISHPVGWGLYITNFVFWVGIAHSGTLISAILFLFRARWRTAIARSSEAMTVFAVMTAGLFPLVHLGRPWYFFWLLPYPNQRELQPNFRSPLVWDVFAISTYLIISSVFLYLGLIPDLAAARDAARGARRKLYGLLALGWRGTGRQWRSFSSAYLLFCGLATPLVVSVHSVVSWDFAMGIVPGWHATIFAPYFVAGAILSGLAMVLTLSIPLRRLLRLEAYITMRHFENLAKLILLTSLIVGYAYVVEAHLAWGSGDRIERDSFGLRFHGSWESPLFWLMVACNAVIPLLFFARRVRTHLPSLFGIALLINVGMYLERLVIISGSLSHDFLPAVWRGYHPTWVEASITLGSFGWFLMWFVLFVRQAPPLPIAELKEHLQEASL